MDLLGGLGGAPGFWVLGLWDSGLLELRDFGFWDSGLRTLGLWDSGIVGLWDPGTLLGKCESGWFSSFFFSFIVLFWFLFCGLPRWFGWSFRILDSMILEFWNSGIEGRWDSRILGL